jgi:hypothetical protein
MRFSSSLVACVLTAFRHVSALDMTLLRELAELADQGLNADGTPILPLYPSNTSTLESFSRIASQPDDGEVIVPEYVELPLDHFAKNQDFGYEGTFFNRFWVKSGAYRPGGPVFLYDVGEADGEPYWRTRLENKTSWFREMMETFGGVGIVWEHRFCESTFV